MALPDNIAREHILEALERIDNEGVPADARSTTYDVVFQGGKYPPKLVLSWANSAANGEELERALFDGGQNTKCFQIIASNGFSIQRKRLADIANKVPYFERSDFVALERLANQKRDSNNEAQNQDWAVLKEAYEKTKFWMDEVAKNTFPGGSTSIRRDPTNQAGIFHEYNWAKLYPCTRAKEVKKLAYTVGIHAGRGFIIKIDTVNQSGEKRQQYETYRDHKTPSEIRLSIPIDEGLALGWQGLIERSIEYFREMEPHYDALNEMLGYGIYPAIGTSSTSDTEFHPILQQFLQQENDLSTSAYPRTFSGLPMKVSFGVGNLARIPWIAFIAPGQKVSEGIYPVYLHYKELNCLILAYGVSETNAPDVGWDDGGKQTIKDYFSENFSSKPARYGSSFVYRVYDLQQPLQPATIDNDLESLLGEYKSLVTHEEPELTMGPSITDIASKDWLPEVCRLMAANGFYYSKADVANFYLSLRTKPFVILAGISGTGKTQIVRQFAKALGYGDERHSVLIPVRPDWADNTDLVGYRNIQGVFEQQKLLQVLQDAIQHPSEPFFVILDEMNLARVEHYFSDFLSVMETREKDSNGAICTSSIVDDDTVNGGMPVYIPQNVMVVGTVNMDETTHPFSRKVLDRANALEMNTIDLSWVDAGEPGDGSNVVEGVFADAFVSPYLNANKDLSADQKSSLDEIVRLLVDINQLLEPAGLHFGYRVRDEIAFYMTQHRELGFAGADLMSEKDALDYQLMQKVLPRIQGSSIAVLNTLIAILKKLTKAELAPEMEFEAVEKAVGSIEERPDYPRSVKKLLFMLRRFHEDGFTSFWL